MHTNLFFLTISASAMLLLTSCGGQTTTETPTTAAPATSATAVSADTTGTPSNGTVASYYTCPMHPEVHSDQPGKCPKCGMTLVKK